MKKQKYTFFSLLFIMVLMMLAVGSLVSAAQTDSITATVTVQNISVTIADGTVAYGTLATSNNQNTTASGLDDSQTATNNGNITENFNIMGQDSAAWELADTAGSEAYTHKFCITTCDSSPSWTAFNEDGYTTLATGISASGNQVFDLQIGTPISTATYTQQVVDITVQAVAG